MRSCARKCNMPLGRHLLKCRYERLGEGNLAFRLSSEHLQPVQVPSLWAAWFVNLLSVNRKCTNGFNRNHFFFLSSYRSFFWYLLTVFCNYCYLYYDILFFFTRIFVHWLEIRISFYHQLIKYKHYNICIIIFVLHINIIINNTFLKRYFF